MQKPNKESFQLLQLSEDSKSASDLELPEILPQRKRKVRRKTRNTGGPLDRLNISGNALHGGDAVPALCQNIGVWIAIFMTSGWLLILSYMTTVVYTENRRLEQQITKLSVNNFNLPDVLQKWHETSKSLAGNQTVVNGRLLDVQQRLDDLDQKFITMRDDINVKNSKNNYEQMINELRNNFASFGANLKSLSIEIDGIKVQQNTTKTRVELLTKQYEQYFNNKTILMSPPAAAGEQLHNETLQLISNLTNNVKIKLDNISATIFTLNDTFSQRIHGLDDDFHSHQVKLDTLMENVTSLSTHVISMEDVWTKYRIKDGNKTVPEAKSAAINSSNGEGENFMP